MLDNRSLISPGLSFFDSQNSPLNTLDVERIEVVLGPSSALFGPDVTSGVVHFISKDPFRHPGTTIELLYGEKNVFKSALRHANHSKNGKLGYKINARYNSGKDFTLNPGDSLDDVTLGSFQEYISKGFVTEDLVVDPSVEGDSLFYLGQMQENEFWAGAINGHLHYKLGAQTEIIGSGGWNGGGSIFYNDLGEGYSQSNEIWAQLRFKHKGLFAQAYLIDNDGGSDSKPSYLNRSGLISPLERKHYEGQVQYSFQTPALLNIEWTSGLDYRLAKANSDNHVYGRNEDNDDYGIVGAYLQGKMALGDQFDLLLAGRYDTYNFTDENTFSPRAAFVYNANNHHSFRLTYNKAANPVPSALMFFDFPLQSTPLFNVWISGAINKPSFSDPKVSWLIPGVSETSLETGFPLAAAYSAVNPNVIAGIEALGQQDPELAPLVPLLVQLLQSQAPSGFSNSIISTDLNGNNLLSENAETDLISSFTSYELGYKGLIANKLSAQVNIYHNRRQGGVRFTQISPVITLASLPEDLGADVQATFQPQIQAVLESNGYDPYYCTNHSSRSSCLIKWGLYRSRSWLP